MSVKAATVVARGVSHRGWPGHGRVVEWTGQSTIHPTGDPRGPTYGSEGWGSTEGRISRGFGCQKLENHDSGPSPYPKQSH